MFKTQLKAYRKSLGLTQQQVATILDISRQCYNGYELGTRQPNIDVIKKLCIIFDCSADELLEIETEAKRDKILKINKK